MILNQLIEAREINLKMNLNLQKPQVTYLDYPIMN